VNLKKKKSKGPLDPLNWTELNQILQIAVFDSLCNVLRAK
jgi:hypothetical protein